MNENAELRQELLERAEAHHTEVVLAKLIESMALRIVAEMRDEIVLLRKTVEELEHHDHRME